MMARSNEKKARAQSSEPSRARGKAKGAPVAPPKGAPVAPPKGAPVAPPKGRDPVKGEKAPEVKRGVGHPPGPDKWTPDYIAKVAKLIRDYADKTDYPTEAEFCYMYDIRFQRLSEYPELRDAKDYLFAKRQAQLIKRGMELDRESALGAFMLRLAANAGPYSLSDKSELAHSGSMAVILDDIPAKKGE
jgi:hypothetical protein